MGVLPVNRVCCGTSARVVDVRVKGASEIVEGIPASEAEGWTIEFDRVLVVAKSVNPHECSEVVDVHRVFDLKAASGDSAEAPVVAEIPIFGPAGGFETSVGFLPSATATSGNASQADVELMTSNGYSLYIELTATKGDATKTMTFFTDVFFPGRTCYEGESSEAFMPIMQIAQVHPERLFRDNEIGEAIVNGQFEIFAAADANEDGVITPEELMAVDSGDRGQTLWELIENRVFDIAIDVDCQIIVT